MEHYRHRETTYHIAVVQTSAAADGNAHVMTMTLDGVSRDDAALPLVDDRQEHWVEVSVQAKPAGAPARTGPNDDGNPPSPVATNLAPIA